MIQVLSGQTLRELGGFIWIQITVLIIFIRVVFSSIATGWRYRRREYFEAPKHGRLAR